MNQGADSGAPEPFPHEGRPDGDRQWPFAGASLARPRAIESKTLTALLILFLVASDKDEKALPASERILTLVTELQHNRVEAAEDTQRRASVITQLSAAISGFRRDLD